MSYNKGAGTSESDNLRKWESKTEPDDTRCKDYKKDSKHAGKTKGRFQQIRSILYLLNECIF